MLSELAVAAHAGDPPPRLSSSQYVRIHRHRVEVGLAAVGAAVAAAVAATALDDGGFSAGSQTVLILLSAVALLIAVLFDPDQVTAVARQLPVLVLVALAGVEAAIGLSAAALHSLPDAERIGGSWRPGGTFQYPPTLGLLQVAALPVLLRGMTAGRLVAVAAALGAALAGAVLGCAGSRLDLVFAAAVALVALAWPPRARHRGELLAAFVLIVLAAIGGHSLLGEHVSRGAGGSAARLVLADVLCLVLAAAWLPVQAFARRRRPRSSPQSWALEGCSWACALGGCLAVHHR